MSAEPEERLNPSDNEKAGAWVQSIVDKDQETRTAEAKAIQEEGRHKQKTKLPVLIAIVAVLAGLTFWDRNIRQDPIRQTTRLEQQTSTVLGFQLAQHFVEAYRDSAGHIPQVLEEATPYPMAVNYEKVNENRYTLRGESPNQSLYFDSKGARPDLNRYAGKLIGEQSK